MSATFSHVDDALVIVEDKLEFIALAVNAIGDAEARLIGCPAAWRGLFYITEEILETVKTARGMVA